MAVLNLVINGRERSVSVAPEEKLLWVLRDRLGLTGTKYGCGRATRSCVTPVSTVAGAGLVLGFHLPWGRRLPIQPEDLRRS